MPIDAGTDSEGRRFGAIIGGKRELPLREGRKNRAIRVNWPSSESQLKSVSVVSHEHVPERRCVSRPHGDSAGLSDDSEQLVRHRPAKR